MKRVQNQFFVGKTINMPRITKYGAKSDYVKVVRFVKKGRRSYFCVQSQDGRVFNVPSKYIGCKKGRLTNAIKLPVPDTSKPYENKPKKAGE